MIGMGSTQGVPVGSGAGLDDRHELVAFEGVLGHLAIAGLEDVQREDDMGEQDDVRQGEEPASPGEIREFRVNIHGPLRPSAGVRIDPDGATRSKEDA